MKAIRDGKVIQFNLYRTESKKTFDCHTIFSVVLATVLLISIISCSLNKTHLPHEFIWKSKAEGYAKNGTFVRTASPAFEFEYPVGSEKMAIAHPTQILAMEFPFDANLSISIDDIPDGVSMADYGPRVYVPNLNSFLTSKKFKDDDSKIEILSIKEMTLKDGTKASRMELKWLHQNGAPMTTTLTSAISNGKLVNISSTSWNPLVSPKKYASIVGSLSFRNYRSTTVSAVSTTFEPEKIVVEKLSDINKWGLIIGIEKYTQLPTVQFAERDALLIKKCFINIMKVPEENIIYLLNEEATKARIEGYLKDYFPMNVEQDTILYVYFAGHGIPSVKDNDAYLIPFDGDPRFIERTGYKLDNLYTDLNNLKIKRSIIFIDGCFSGVASRNQQMLLAGARPALIRLNEIKLESTKVISLAASSGSQISNSYPPKKHGLFTYYLSEGLNGLADSNRDQAISVQELYVYIRYNVSKASRRMGVEQTPVIMPSTDAIEAIILNKVN